MLESESRDLSTIHISSLHVIRLGADGTGVTTSQKVEDESTRSDFELISGSSRSCKIFSKELASPQPEKQVLLVCVVQVILLILAQKAYPPQSLLQVEEGVWLSRPHAQEGTVIQVQKSQ